MSPVLWAAPGIRIRFDGAAGRGDTCLLQKNHVAPGHREARRILSGRHLLGPLLIAARELETRRDDRRAAMTAIAAPVLKGVALSSGLGRGKAVVLARAGGWSHAEGPIAASDLEAEVSRFREACARSAGALQALRHAAASHAGGAAAEILQAQELLLHDHVFLDLVSQRIRGRALPAEAAVGEVVDELSGAFAELQDPYIRERAADIRDVGHRVQLDLGGGRHDLDLPAGSVLVAAELSASLVATLDPAKVMAVVTQLGAKASHAAILLRSLGIPAVGAIPDLLESVPAGSALVVDGIAGLVFVEPAAGVAAAYDKLEADLRAHDALLQTEALLPATTADGVAIRLEANLGKAADTEAAVRWNADGVGLYRTEFAFDIRDRFPTEDEQTAILRGVAERLSPRPVVFRLLDIGAEKTLPYFPLPAVANPALNLRGTRLLLAHPALLRSQLRAILRVSGAHPVAALLPMVGGLEEVRAVRALLQELTADLRAHRVPFDEAMPLGAMIEVPAAAIVAGDLALELDFLSLGTNDLVQYLLAADRDDPAMSGYYRALHPAVLRLIRSAVIAVGRAGKPLTLCGEMAGDPFYTELLLGLGLRSLSVAPRQLGEVRHEIRRIEVRAATALARRVLGRATRDEIRDMLERRFAARGDSRA
jgi:phosphoenolpyruvate-protein phosphotransferase